MRIILLLTLVSALLLGATSAQARSWTIDGYHTQAGFSIRHVAGKVTGFFNAFEGTVTDPDIPGHGAIDVRIRVDSINTGVAQRDAHLKTPDFFDAAKHPLIRFRSTDIRARPDGGYEAHGTLTIRGTSRPAVLPYTLSRVTAYPPVPDMQCTDALGFAAGYTLNRLDFGVGDGKFLKMGMVGDRVEITLNGEMLSPREGCK